MRHEATRRSSDLTSSLVGGCTRFQSIWPAPQNGVLFTLTGAEPDVDGRRLAGGRRQPAKGEAGMGTSLADPRVEGGGRADLGAVLLGGSPGNAPFWVGDVSGDPLYGKVPGRFPPPGGAKDHGSTPPKTSRWELVLTSAGRRDENSGAGGAGDIYFQEAEYSGPEYCY